MKEKFGFLIIALGWILGLYLGIWTCLIYPIIYACQCFDAGTLTAVIVGITVLKCFFAGTIAIVIIYTGYSLGGYLIKTGRKSKQKINHEEMIKTTYNI